MQASSVGWLPIFILFALVLGGAGLLLLILGLRGRKVDDHPLCRKCKFDLTGRPETSTRCPECGTELTASAIIHGHRRRSAPKLWAGVMLLLFGLATTGIVVTAIAGNINWMEYKPVWWLTREARSSVATTRTPALNELQRRITATELSQAQIDALADEALAIQADQTKTWDSGWGNIVESARSGNQLDQQRWVRYARQAVQVKVVPRDTVLRGQPLALNLYTPGRTGTRNFFYGDFTIDTLIDNGVILHKQHGSFGTSISTGDHGWMSTSIDLSKHLKNLMDGPQHQTVQVSMKVREDPTGNTSGAPTLAQFTIELPIDWTLVSTPTVEMIDDASKLSAVVAAFQSVKLTRASWRKGLDINLQLQNLPVSLSHDVYISAGEQEFKAFTLTMLPGNMGYGTGCELPKFALPETVDLIFRPNPMNAETTVSVKQCWNYEFTISRVRVPPPATQPSGS